MRNLVLIFIGIFTITLISTPAAFSLDTSSPLLCSVISASECSLEDGCVVGTAETYDLPQFVKLDFQKNMISEVGENSLKRESKIKNHERIENKIVIQGVENGRAWSVIVDEKTGKMSAAVSEERIGFVVFGACTSL